ncbi:hypothetical protein M8C21_000024 [Ambrosia artemisiifolia]|uniref:Uncharacterized protein n=1 Tax=Ambrosia artemisiifolia TaxID=4212 RepID=A0AAD5GJE5_AMBAR|nr:hypothetical protein M8C21_000024 [Ambrosia artemisiifolia]
MYTLTLGFTGKIWATLDLIPDFLDKIWVSICPQFMFRLGLYIHRHKSQVGTGSGECKLGGGCQPQTMEKQHESKIGQGVLVGIIDVMNEQQHP